MSQTKNLLELCIVEALFEAVADLMLVSQDNDHQLRIDMINDIEKLIGYTNDAGFVDKFVPHRFMHELDEFKKKWFNLKQHILSYVAPQRDAKSVQAKIPWNEFVQIKDRMLTRRKMIEEASPFYHQLNTAAQQAATTLVSSVLEQQTKQQLPPRQYIRNVPNPVPATAHSPGYQPAAPHPKRAIKIRNMGFDDDDNVVLTDNDDDDVSSLATSRASSVTQSVNSQGGVSFTHNMPWSRKNKKKEDSVDKDDVSPNPFFDALPSTQLPKPKEKNFIHQLWLDTSVGTQ